MVGSIGISEFIRKTKDGFRNSNDYEIYNNSLDENGYEIDDSTFSGYIYKSVSPLPNIG